MRVLHVIPSLSLTSGGPSLALPAMAKALSNAGIQVDVATTDDEGRGLRKQDVPLGEPVALDGFRVYYFAKQTEFYKASLPLYSWLMRHVKDYEVVHIHALFSFASIAAARAARKHGVPYIIRPLGVLNAYGMRKRQWLKKISFRFLERPALDHAAAMHYTSPQERDEAAILQIKAPAHVIPLGIDLTPFQKLPAAEIFYQRFPETRERQIILFLSRIDPKKGLELLLDAFKKLQASYPNVHLVIAGSGMEQYAKELRNLAVRLGIADKTTWTGQLDGELKLSALAAATLFVLPSFSENFGIALLEALAAGVASVSSDHVALAHDAASVSALCMVKCDADEIANAFRIQLHDDKLRRDMASRGKQLAYERYSLSAIGSSLRKLYITLTDH